MHAAARRLNLLGWAVASAFALYLVLHLFFLIDSYSVNVPWWDNFNYYFLLADGPNYWSRFTAQLGPHREGVSLLLSSLIAPLSHWDMRAEAFTIGAILTLASITCLWTKRRAFGYLSAADLAFIPAILLTPRQFYHWSFVINSAHSALPLLFLMLYCLSCTIKNDAKREAVVLTVAFFSVFTGFGFFIGILAFAMFIARRNWRASAIAALIFALFFIDYRLDPANPDFRLFDPNIIVFPYSIAVGLANVLGFTEPPFNQIIGYPVLAAIIAVLAVHFRSFPRLPSASIIIVSLIGFGFLFMLFALEGRISAGRNCLVESRYIPLISPAFLGLYLAISQLHARWLKVACLTIAIGLAAHTSAMVSKDDSNSMERLKAVKQIWIHTYLQTNDLDAADRASRIPIYPHPRPLDLPQKLRFLKAHRLSFYSDWPESGKSSR
jgi:hypothetical protein